MAVYTIIRIYQVPAESQQQATDRMAEALALNTEKNYHVKDIVRGPYGKRKQERTVDFRSS